MKKQILALALAGCALLSGCKAMLERSYSSSTPHADRPTTAEDPSVLRVENYRELVSAVLYLVSQRAEEGVIQLQNYDGEAESDLTAACLEVSTQDPLGAYAVEYIKNELSRVVSYYQATLAIHYRRSAEQMESIVSVNGDSAIRDQLLKALAEFSGEAVLRVPYFFGGEETVKELLREAYYAHPALALGLPEAEVHLYPDSGRERIVELTLTYPEEPDTLREKSKELTLQAARLMPAQSGREREESARGALDALWSVRDSGAGEDGENTAYAALVEGRAGNEGMALGYALLCAQAGVPWRLQQGTLDGEARSWVEVELTGGERRWVDPSLPPEDGGGLYGEEEFFARGYFLPET